MPFKSEKQRKDLWANEPEIARDWTDTYGSRIQKEDGGITNVPLQAGAENHLGEQEMVTVPKYWKSGKDHPETELAYITKPELDLILKADFHGSLKDGPNVGPSGIMSLNDPGTGRSGTEMSSAETTGSFGPGVGPTDESRALRASHIAAGAPPRLGEDKFAAFNKSQWDQRNIPFNQRTKPGGTGIGGGWKRFTNFMRTVDGKVMPQSYFSEEERNKRRAQRGIETILGRKNPVTNLTNKRLNQLYSTLETPYAQRNLFADADVGRSPEMMNMSNLGLYTDRVSEPIGPGERIGEYWRDNQGITGTQAYEHFSPNVALSKRYPAGFSDEMTDDVALSKLRAGSDIDVMKGSVLDKKSFDWSSLNPLNLIFGTPAEAKNYTLEDLKALGAKEGLIYGGNKQLDALENFYQGAKKFTGTPKGSLDFWNPSDVRSKVGSLGDIPFSGYENVNMDLIPQDFLSDKTDFTTQQSPYELFGIK